MPRKKKEPEEKLQGKKNVILTVNGVTEIDLTKLDGFTQGEKKLIYQDTKVKLHIHLLEGTN